MVTKIILILNKIRPNKKSTIYNNHCNKIHNLIVNRWVGLLHWEELPKVFWKHNNNNNNNNNNNDIDDTTVSCINGVKEEAKTISYHGNVECYIAVRLTIGLISKTKTCQMQGTFGYISEPSSTHCTPRKVVKKMQCFTMGKWKTKSFPFFHSTPVKCF